MTSTADIAYLNYDTNDGSPGDISNRNGAHYVPLQVDYFENQQQHQDQQRLLQTLPQVPYTCEEFVNKLWKLAEDDLGLDTNSIEEGRLVRTGNHRTKSSKAQRLAMYGRIKPKALERVFQIMNLQSSDIFIDIGHGIGNATLQAAYTRGCESRGIEIMEDRNLIAEQFKVKLADIKHLHHVERDGDIRHVGDIRFVEGDFTLKCHKNFITTDRSRVVKAFVNNAHGVFGHRSEIHGRPTLDEYCASLFAHLSPGSIMVTVYPFYGLGRSLTEENQYRENTLKLSSHIDASFFEHETHSIGTNAASWGDYEVIVNVYKRVEQSNEDGLSSFLCSNVACEACLNGIATVALKDEDKSDERISTLKNECVYCGHKRLRATRLRSADSDISNQDEDEGDGDCRKSKRKRRNIKSDDWK